MSDHAKIVRERVSHIARGCRAGTSHNPAVYENDINAALDALVADRDAWIKAAADNGAAQDAAEKERDRVLGAYHRENDGRLAAEAELEVEKKRLREMQPIMRLSDDLHAAEAERDEARRERDKALLSAEGLSKRLTIAVAAEAEIVRLRAELGER